MRLLILVILLAIVNGHAVAEWVKVGDDARTIAYADLGTIRKIGNIVRMWQMVDYKMSSDTQATRGKDIKSVKLHAEYNCDEGLVRALYASYYPENMGRGMANWTMPEPAMWEPVPSGGISENLWKLPCGKK